MIWSPYQDLNLDLTAPNGKCNLITLYGDKNNRKVFVARHPKLAFCLLNPSSKLAYPVGIEPTTFGFGGHCSA